MNYVVGPGNNEDMYHRRQAPPSCRPALYYSKLYLISICTKLYLMQSLDGKIPTTSSGSEMEGRAALSSHQVLGCKIPRVENRAKD